MAAKRHERTTARRAALQVLYTSEITDESPSAIAEGNRRLDEDGPMSDYALTLVRGVESHRFAIDKHLAATSENWSLARMPIVDRSILRLATFEMMYVDDVPTSVTINEAVELAKDFGGEDESHRFVNGILGRIAKMLEQEQEGALDPGAAAPCVADAADERKESPGMQEAGSAAQEGDSKQQVDSAEQEAGPAEQRAAQEANLAEPEAGEESHGA